MAHRVGNALIDEVGKHTRGPVDIDTFYHKQPPKLPREKWKTGKMHIPGSPIELKSNFVFDKGKCLECGGKGKVWKPVGFHGRRKRLVSCDCQIS